MTVISNSNIVDKPLKVNWINESILGALLSAAFTILASFSGTKGVEPDSLVAQWHEYMIWGGVTMSALCCATALVLFVAKMTKSALDGVHDLTMELSAPLGKGRGLQFAKFIKIFIP